MKIYTCTDFTGKWPVGVSAIIVAPGLVTAMRFLLEELAYAGMPQDNNYSPTLVEIDQYRPSVTILQNGDY